MKKKLSLAAVLMLLAFVSVSPAAVLFDIDFTGETVGVRPPPGSAVAGGTATKLTAVSPASGNADWYVLTQVGTLNGVSFGDGNFLAARDTDATFNTTVSLAASLHADDYVSTVSADKVAVFSFDIMRAGIAGSTGTFFFAARGGDKDTTQIDAYASFSLNCATGSISLSGAGILSGGGVVDTLPVATSRLIRVELNYATGVLSYWADGNQLATATFNTDYAFKRLTITTGTPASTHLLVGVDNIRIESIPEPGVVALLGLGGLSLFLRRRFSARR